MSRLNAECDNAASLLFLCTRIRALPAAERSPLRSVASFSGVDTYANKNKYTESPGN